MNDLPTNTGTTDCTYRFSVIDYGFDQPVISIEALPPFYADWHILDWLVFLVLCGAGFIFYLHLLTTIYSWALTLSL